MDDKTNNSQMDGCHPLTAEEMPALFIPNVPPSQVSHEGEDWHTLTVEEMPTLFIPSVPPSRMFLGVEAESSTPNEDSQ